MALVTLKGYLEGDYLEGPYLEDSVVGETTGFQATLQGKDQKITGMQASFKILSSLASGFQALLKILTDKTAGMQATLKRAHVTGIQGTFTIYNVTQLRILYQFPSRGAESVGGGNNAWGEELGTGKTWVASSTMAGDFLANNLNSDVPEEVWRSDTGDISGVSLRCDTERVQGVFLDTFAILNHNFTRSADIVLQGSNDSSFSSIGFQTTLLVDPKRNDIFYIAPELPTQGWRYWRILIDDPTNPFDYLEAGICIFGPAAILTYADDFELPLQKGKTDFKDVLATEGFTEISNHRATRRWLTLTFASMSITEGNYNMLEEVINSIKTDLKALWIPTPDFPGRHAIFGKLAALPDESVVSHDEDHEYYDFELKIDEAK